VAFRSFFLKAAACAAFAFSALAAPSLRAEPAAAKPFTTSVPHVFLMDADTGTVLFEKGADDLVVPAATVKIMTAELVFHALVKGRLHLDDEFTVSDHAWMTGGAPARASSMFAAVHSKISVANLLRGLIIVSGNDAAIVLAEGIAGSESAFAKLMTQRAHKLGFNHLTFTDVWGRDDPDQRVTARDMAELSAYVIKTYPQFYKWFGRRDFTWNKIHQYNRNPLLAMNIGADGLKTGNVGKSSGYSLVASAVQNGQRLVLAMYGARTPKERAAEARKILDWGFRSFAMKTLFKAGEVVGSASMFEGTREYVPLLADAPIKVLVPRGATDPLTARIVYTGPIQAPIKKGDQIARLQVMRGKDRILSAPLQAAVSVGVGPLPRRAMDAGLELGIGMFRKYVLKE